MVKDPVAQPENWVELSGMVRRHFESSDEPLFSFNKKGSIVLTTSYGHAGFAIVNVGYVINGGAVNREQFLEQMIEEYPDYMEWFLFHPEWLK